MRKILAFLLTPIIVSLFAVLLMAIDKGVGHAIENTSFQFVIMFQILGPAIFISGFVYFFEFILFVPFYLYLFKRGMLTFKKLVVGSMLFSLISGSLLSLVIKNNIELKALFFYFVFGLSCGMVFIFIHGNIIYNNKRNGDSGATAPPPVR